MWVLDMLRTTRKIATLVLSIIKLKILCDKEKASKKLPPKDTEWHTKNWASECPQTSPASTGNRREREQSLGIVRISSSNPGFYCSQVINLNYSVFEVRKFPAEQQCNMGEAKDMEPCRASIQHGEETCNWSECQEEMGALL